MVAQESLELFVMVRIHAGQPVLLRKTANWQRQPNIYQTFFQDLLPLRESLEIPKRRKGLRHRFITAHYAAHSNEGLTARQAGNSLAMVHQHYNGLWRKAEGEAWFAVAPEQAANVIPLPAVSRQDAQ
jgi:hypothetical protein